MSEPFLAEVRMVGFNFAPRGWALCDGQIMPINQNQSLYSLLGTTYGGDGRTSFALPDMRGRAPIHVGNGHSEGQKGGEETHTLSISEMPQHKHVVNASHDNATATSPGGRSLAGARENTYSAFDSANAVAMASSFLTHTGGGQAHENMQPYTTLNFCIALQGLFPSRN